MAFLPLICPPPVGGGVGIFTVKMHTIKWGWAYLRKKITVNMPPLKSSLIKPSKSMLFFHIWNANFSVTPINSQMYMTKPKQVQKKLSENTGKTFSVIMPPFTSRGWAYLRKLLYKNLFWTRVWGGAWKGGTWDSHRVWISIFQPHLIGPRVTR